MKHGEGHAAVKRFKEFKNGLNSNPDKSSINTKDLYSSIDLLKL